MAEQKNANRLISNNKKAYFDYFIEDKYEAGLVLHGTEVKSIRMGKCSIKEAYIQIQNGEVFINNMNITPYEKGLPRRGRSGAALCPSAASPSACTARWRGCSCL